MSLTRSLTDTESFTLTFELVPGPGGKSRQINRILSLAEQMAADGRFLALSITENAGGHPALSPEVLGKEILAMGLEVIIHLSCKDKNRNQIESLLFAWSREEMHNLLVMAGDYPQEGYLGCPKPVYDLDTVQALDMISSLNKGKDGSGNTKHILPTSFYKGVVVSPFKLLESEQVMQYFKLLRKIEAGADFVITQLGFDARKFHELIQFKQEYGVTVPLLGNVFIPNMAVAQRMYNGKIPGCVIPETLYAQLQWEARAADGGKEMRLQRAARLLAVLKGMGYNGAHIGGPQLEFSDLAFVLDEADNYAENWLECIPELTFWPKGAFYYYCKDAATGLNRPETAARQVTTRERFPFYSFSILIHELVFMPRGPLFKGMRGLCLLFAEGRYHNLLSHVEHSIKSILFSCRNCGDCTLAELAFLCPQSGCAKYLLNGPCGGSRDGWCEVFPGQKRCLYVQAYERLKSRGLEQELAKGFLPPRNWGLNNTSSWVNFFMGRDHTSRNRELPAAGLQTCKPGAKKTF